MDRTVLTQNVLVRRLAASSRRAISMIVPTRPPHPIQRTRRLSIQARETLTELVPQGNRVGHATSKMHDDPSWTIGGRTMDPQEWLQQYDEKLQAAAARAEQADKAMREVNGSANSPNGDVTVRVSASGATTGLVLRPGVRDLEPD